MKRPVAPPPPTASGEITKRQTAVPPRHVVPDPDYIADLEQNDGQIRKRMAQRERGKPIKPPQPL